MVFVPCWIRELLGIFRDVKKTKASHKELKDFLLSECEIQGADGCQYDVFVFPTFVVKISKYVGEEYVNPGDAIGDAAWISKKRQDPKLRVHFPRTEALNSWILLQERVFIETGGGVGSEFYIRMWPEIDKLSRQTGITDIHHENVGWRGTKETYRELKVPVLFDVGIRSGMEVTHSDLF